ncbi:MAG: GNAT family N-acetyltransferase, partial [Ideonella sp.]
MPLQIIDSITTPRLTLRGVTESDLDDLFEINGDAQVTRFLPYVNWQTSDDAQAWLKRTRAVEAAGSGQQLAMVLRDSGKVIGTVLLFRYEEPSARIELGYVLGRLHWGSGVMFEALNAVCSHVFSAMAIRRIEAQVNPDNLASNRLLHRLGFNCEGTLRQRWVNQGQAVDTNFYGLLADDWKGRQQGADCASAPLPGIFPVAINAAEVAPRSKLSNYPEPFASMMAGREKRALGAVFGLQNFGVNLTRLAPHSVSALRHAHTRQDEFIYVLSGRPSLQTDEG